MATTSTVFGYPIPEGEDPNNVPGDVADLVAELDNGFAGARLTQAQIDALPEAYKTIGVHVYNLTSGRLERWTGSAWSQLDWVASAFEVRSSSNATSWAVGGTTASFGLASRPGGTRSARWLFRKTTAAGESTGNAGSDLQIVRLADDGATELGAAVTVRRSDGRVLLGRETAAADPDEAVVTKGYVDGRAIADKLVDTTDGAGQFEITLASPPAGMSWSVTATGDSQVVLASVSGNDVTFTIYALVGGSPPYSLAPLASTIVTVYYHAIAY